MSRLLALASSALLALAVPAAAAPVVFQASAKGSSISLTCGQAMGECTRLEADLLFNDGDARVSGKVNPNLNFGMIKFAGLEAEDDDDDYKAKDKKKDDNKRRSDDKKSSKDNNDQTKKGLFNDRFGITATLAFSILDLPGIFEVVAKGEGTYSVKKEDLKSLTLAWQPIEDLFIEGVGTFAFTFSNLGAINVPSVFARSANRDEEDEDEGDDGINLRVSATVTQVSVVPLPAGGMLLITAFGLLALSARQRRRALAA